MTNLNEIGLSDLNLTELNEVNAGCILDAIIVGVSDFWNGVSSGFHAGAEAGTKAY